MYMKKSIIAALMVVAFFLGTMTGGAGLAGVNDYVVLWINGMALPSWTNPGPRIIDDRVYVPLRAVADYMGATVEWNAQTRTAYIAGYGDPLTIDIQGPESLKKDMRECIDLLREKDPEGYLMVGRYVKTIKFGDYPNPQMNPVEMAVSIPKDKYKTDKIWWAAVLVHEAQHAEQYYSLKRQTEDEREIEAYTRDIQTLKKIGAPQYMIDSTEQAIKNKVWQN
jgi:hypothetical protein